MSNPLRKTVELPIGVSFEIRRLDLFEFLTDVGDLPARVLPAVMERLKETGADEPSAEAERKSLADQRRVMESVLARGVVKPKIWFGDEGETPDGQIHHMDLGIWRWALMQEVIAFSSPEVEQFAGFLRRAGAGVAGPDGQEVRPEALAPGPDGTQR